MLVVRSPKTRSREKSICYNALLTSKGNQNDNRTQIRTAVGVCDQAWLQRRGSRFVLPVLQDRGRGQEVSCVDEAQEAVARPDRAPAGRVLSPRLGDVGKKKPPRGSGASWEGTRAGRSRPYATIRASGQVSPAIPSLATAHRAAARHA